MKIRSKEKLVVSRATGGWSVSGGTFALGLLLCALCLPVAAQEPKKVPRIGFLSGGSPSSFSRFTEAFREGLRELGYVEEKNIAIEYKWAEGINDRLPNLAAELVRLKVDVIVTSGGTTTIFAAKNATERIPIVMASSSDPVETGLVNSLARPGGNITGLTLGGPELYGKRVELLRETVPRVSRAGILFNPANPAAALALKETQAAAHALGLQLQSLEVRSPEDFESVFKAATKAQTGALIVTQQAPIFVHRQRVVALASKSRLPVMYAESEWPNVGGLMSYGPDINDNYRRAATYVDKILKGAKPAELPVERPTKFEFVINLKTAKQIGLTIPQSVLYQADKVIK